MCGHDGVGEEVSERGPELIGSKIEAKMGVGVEMYLTRVGATVPRARSMFNSVGSVRPERPFIDIGTGTHLAFRS